MSNNLVVSTPGQLMTQEKIQILKNTICKGASNEELQLFIAICNRTGLDPTTRQIFAISRYDSRVGREVMQAQISVDGLRVIAERSGKYTGQDGPYFCGPDGVWKDCWLDREPPVAAKVGVCRSDFEKPLYAVARFNSYKQTTQGGNLNAVWQKMPEVMLAKCAESLALRRAFPMELSGLYSREEMSQADNVSILITPGQLTTLAAMQAQLTAFGFPEDAIEQHIKKTYQVDSIDQITDSDANYLMEQYQKKIEQIERSRNPTQQLDAPEAPEEEDVKKGKKKNA